MHTCIYVSLYANSMYYVYIVYEYMNICMYVDWQVGGDLCASICMFVGRKVYLNISRYEFMNIHICLRRQYKCKSIRDIPSFGEKINKVFLSIIPDKAILTC